MTLAALQTVQSALDAAGPQAARIERLWWIFFWVATIVFILTIVAVLVPVLRRRRGHTALIHEPDLSRVDAVDALMTPPVAMAIAATAAILLLLLVADIWTGRAVASLGAASAVSIDVTGHQWWWEVEYEDALPSQRVKTANEIHIPVGRPVVLKVTSHDVIHSLWVPNLHGKRDLIPGYTTALWIQADRPGIYRGQCAEFCGVQHAHMAFFVTAESNDQFERWLSARRQEAPPPTTPAEQKGQHVFLSSTCTQCHTIRGTIAGASLGPDLTHVASRGTLAAGTIPNSIGHLGGWVVDPQRIKPGNHMPPNSIAGDDLQALLSYLESLK
jgi:cytochrome c oxidase subunit 2